MADLCVQRQRIMTSRDITSSMTGKLKVPNMSMDILVLLLVPNRNYDLGLSIDGVTKDYGRLTDGWIILQEAAKEKIFMLTTQSKIKVLAQVKETGSRMKSENIMQMRNRKDQTMRE